MDLGGQRLGPALGVDGDGLDDLAEFGVDLFQLVGEDQVGFADIADLVAEPGVGQGQGDHAVEGEAEAKRADEGRQPDGDAGLTATANQHRHQGGERQIQSGKEAQGQLAHRSALRIARSVSASRHHGVQGLNDALGCRGNLCGFRTGKLHATRNRIDTDGTA